MQPRSRVTLLGASLAALLALATPAGAQTPDEVKAARQTAAEGLAAYKVGDFAKAAGLFEKAKINYPAAQILRLLGYSQLALEHWESAADALDAALAATTGPLSEADRKDVQAQEAKALAHLGTLNVTSKVSGVELVVDSNSPRMLPLDKPLRLLEGRHRLTAHAANHGDVTDEVTIEGGTAGGIELDPADKALPPPPPKVLAPKPPPPAPPPPPRKGWIPAQKAVGFTLAGTGVALGIAAIGTAVAGAHIRTNVENDIADHRKSYGASCTHDVRLCLFDIAVINQEANRADSARNASVWMGVFSGVLVAGGVVLVVAAPKRETAPSSDASSVSMRCGPTGPGVSCTGAF